MIERERAESLADEQLRRIAEKSALQLMITDCEVRPRGWVFYYNTRQFVETQEFRYLLGGNGPIIVTHDGDVSVGPTDPSLDDVLAELVG